MSWSTERTSQLYDPLGALGSRWFAIVISFAAVAGTGVSSVFFRDVPGSAVLSVTTVALVGCAATVVTIGTSPFRAPLPRRVFVMHLALLAVATVTSVFAQAGPDTHRANDVLPLVSAVGIVVMAPYRPPLDLLVGGGALATVNGVAFALQEAVFPTQIPVLVAALLAAGPSLVLAAASSVFSRAMVSLAERVQIRASSYSVERAERDGIADIVRHDRATILITDVAPFLRELRARGEIDAADRLHARRMADGIRRLMVADADRTWLGHMLRAERASAAFIDDPDSLIDTMDLDQRTVFRSFVRALFRAASVDPAGVHLMIGRGGEAAAAATCSECVVVRIDAHAAASRRQIHRTFDPYLALLRVTFLDLDVTVTNSRLALRFSYDQR